MLQVLKIGLVLAAALCLSCSGKMAPMEFQQTAQLAEAAAFPLERMNADEPEPISAEEPELTRSAEEEPEEPAPYFPLSDSELHTVCCMVMGEAGAESDKGKMLVAQCILDACEQDGLRPDEVRRQYQYAGWNENYTQEVVGAVKKVFEEGQRVTEQQTLYFYAPGLCRSGWHESQTFVIEEGGHRFFR